MKGDFTRSTWNPAKRYNGVRQQQGRVQTDADWNEQVDIGAYLRETGLGDLIGRCGAPRTGGGFKVGLNADATDLTLSAGRLYVDGILCELAQDATYTAQLDGLDPALSAALKPALPGATGSCFVYTDVWQRHVTALEDPAIRETALGGPDTATRTQTFWQVKLLPVAAGSHCLSSPRAWQGATAAPTGMLKARTHPGEPSTGPCTVPANAGYTRLENQLYRVEVHQGGTLGNATFKWSRDNGSVVSEWTSVDNADTRKPKLTARDAGRDKALGFAPGQWVEVTDDTHEVQGIPGVLAKLLDAQGTVLTLDLAAGPVLSLADFPVHPKVRRWDSAGPATIAQPAGNDGWLPLEDGVEVRFEAGTYRAGDYWLIPARAFIGEFSGDIEWPQEGGKPVSLPPAGVAHHFCKLAVVDFDAGSKKLSNVRDCRLLFPAATEMIHLFHVGGDGQEALPGQALACPLEVGVTNGQWPVPGARVEFQAGAGTLSAGLVQTDANGVARCSWTLPAAPPDGRISCLSATATLRDVAGNPVSIPVVFHARLSIASQVAYDPSQSPDLQAAGADTVQKAIDELAKRGAKEEPGIHIRAVIVFGDDVFVNNDDLLPVHQLARGLRIACDQEISPDFFKLDNPDLPVPAKPNFQVILYLPYPLEPAARDFWSGASAAGVLAFQPFLLAGRASAQGKDMFWQPTAETSKWLDAPLFRRLTALQPPVARLLVRVVIQGSFIWSAASPGLFLDGDVFGRPGPKGHVNLGLPSGDGRRGGNFEMWFWVAQEVSPGGPNLTVSVDGNLVLGSLRDAAGAAIPGAKISLVAAAGGGTRTAVTTAAGDFRFDTVPIGRFTVQAEIPGAPPLTKDITVSPVLPPVNPNPVILNPVILNPVIAQPAGPAGPGLTSTEPETPAGAKLTDVRGIGRARAALLAGSGINTPAGLVATEPARLAEILSVPEETARTLVESARAVLKGEG
jgi:hypothetical protein